MKISELIEMLREIMEKHGDLDVARADWFGHPEPYEKSEIYVKTANKKPFLAISPPWIVEEPD